MDEDQSRDTTCNGCARPVSNCECFKRLTAGPDAAKGGLTVTVSFTAFFPDVPVVTGPVPDGVVPTLLGTVPANDVDRGASVFGYVKDGVVTITRIDLTPSGDPAYVAGAPRHVMHPSHQLPLGLTGGCGGAGGVFVGSAGIVGGSGGIGGTDANGYMGQPNSAGGVASFGYGSAGAPGLPDIVWIKP